MTTLKSLIKESTRRRKELEQIGLKNDIINNTIDYLKDIEKYKRVM